MRHSISAFILLFITVALLQGGIYEVGPSKAYTSIGAVPWESLAAGDTVRIYYRAAPYAEKILICTGGTEVDPIIIEGIADASGNRPVITGANATTRSTLDFYGETRALIKLGERILTRDGSDVPQTFTDGADIKNIIIQGLELRSARSAYSYSNYNSDTVGYANNAAGIFAEECENLIIRDCVIHDCGNGLFTAYRTKNVLVCNNYIYNNGHTSSTTIHNVYTESQGIVFEYNHLAPLRSGCNGNNLKDRSIGTVVRYNWIEGGNRQLDLVNVDDGSYSAEHYYTYYNDPEYWTAYVYGNVLYEPSNDGNAQIVHFGGDAGGLGSYKTQLYFYNNTIISKRTDFTSLFMLSRNEQYCDARNNIIYTSLAGSTLGMLDGPDYSRGHLSLRSNWVKPGWVDTHFTIHTAATIDEPVANIEGSDPGLTDINNDDFTIDTGSDCINAAIALNAAVLTDHDIDREYVLHTSGTNRPDINDLGALMYANTVPGRVSFQVAVDSVDEDGTSLSVNVVRDLGSDDAFQARIISSDGSASSASDYTAVDETLSWTDGEDGSKSFSVLISDNSIYEGDKTFYLTLSTTTTGAELGTALMTITITEDDPIPAGGLLAFSSSVYAASETSGKITVTVTRSGSYTGAVSVDLDSAAGTATEGADYAPVSTTLDWIDSESGDKTFDIILFNDDSYEGNESFSLALSNPGGGAILIAPTAAIATITDADDSKDEGEEGGCAAGSGSLVPLLLALYFIKRQQ